MRPKNQVSAKFNPSIIHRGGGNSKVCRQRSCKIVKIDKSSQGICKEIAVNIHLTSPFYFYDTFSVVMLALVQRPITSIVSKKVKRFLLGISKNNDCSAQLTRCHFFNRLTYFLGLTVQCFLSHLKRKLRVRLVGELGSGPLCINIPKNKWIFSRMLPMPDRL